MSFQNMKNRSKTLDFRQLAEKMANENKSANNVDPRFWRPEVDKSGNGYALVRFLPAPEGNDFPYVKYYSHSFQVGGKWYIQNCPTTHQKGSNVCPVCDANRELWNTGIEDNKKIVQARSRKVNYISNVLVISDPKAPENEGQVKLFRFGSKIFEKLKNAMSPAEEFPDEIAYDPFDFWEGAPFKIKIQTVKKYLNYDKSEFGNRGPLFNDDEMLEKIWNSEYSLHEFVSPDKFKNYDDLKKEFMNVVSSVQSYSNVTREEDEQEEEDTFKVEPKGAKPQQKTSKNQSDSDDDDFKLFSSMLGD